MKPPIHFMQVLQMSLGDQAIMTSGHVINLISNDIQRFDAAVRFFPNICMAPLAVLTACVVLVYLIGWEALVGLALLAVLIIFQSKAAKLISNLRKKVAELADQRIKLLNEIVRNIRAVKMYAWEEHFKVKVGSVRG